MRKLSAFFALLIFFTFGISVSQTIIQPSTAIVYAADKDMGSVMDEINNGKSVLGNETKEKVAGISNDIQQIVLVIVIAIMMICGIFTAVKFANVGDNPTEKAKLKTTLIWLVCGIVFLASFFGLMKFGFKNFNLFS